MILTELSDEDKLKCRLYNLSNFITICNFLHLIFNTYHLIYYILYYDVKKFILYVIHSFIITPIIFFSIKYFIFNIYILIEIYKICFVVVKFIEFNKEQTYDIIDIQYVLIELYSIYFIYKYLYYISGTSKEVIFLLQDKWKPTNSILYLY